MKLSSLFCLLLGLPTWSDPLKLSTIGVSLHFQVSQKKIWPSLGFEYSYWAFPIGWDAGVEVEKNGIRLYSEAQLGFVAGISSGPVLEIVWGDLYKIESRLFTGFQSSLWLAFGEPYSGGVLDARYRRIAANNTFGLGLFGKLGECHSRCEW
jgi:hypothetical protein